MKFLILFFAFFFLEVYAHGDNNGNKECPALKPEGDLNDPDFLASATSDIVNGLWSSPTPALSADGQDLRSQILAFLATGTNKQKALAATATFWIWTVLPQYGTEPEFGLCPFAQTVDGTVTFLNNNDCSALSSALRNVAGSIVDGSSLAGKTAVTKSGCANANIVRQGDQQQCPGGGLEYQLDELLELVEDDYPECFRELLKELYDSSDPIDRVLAVLTAASISTPLQSMITKFDNSIKLQLFTQSQTSVLPKPCCGAFIRELKVILRKMEDEAEESAQQALTEFGCP